MDNEDHDVIILKISGGGINFNREIDDASAGKIINLILSGKEPSFNGDQIKNEDSNPKNKEFLDFADLFHKAGPKTGPEKALVAGFWLQVCQGGHEFSGYAVNKILDSLGKRIANITTTFSALENQKLAHMVKKTGKGKQSKKLYRIADQGISKVGELLVKGSE